MVIYTSAYEYLSTCQSYRDKAVACDRIIAALLATAEIAAAGDEVTEYSLDDGQTKIKTIYKGADAVFTSIQRFEKLKQFYETLLSNRKNGNIMRLLDIKNLQKGGTNGNF